MFDGSTLGDGANLAKGTYKITIREVNGGGSHDEWFSIM